MQTMMISFAVAVLAVGSCAETRHDVNQTCLLVAPATGFLLRRGKGKGKGKGHQTRAGVRGGPTAAQIKAAEEAQAKLLASLGLK